MMIFCFCDGGNIWDFLLKNGNVSPEQGFSTWKESRLINLNAST
jgi:hypothetical protein